MSGFESLEARRITRRAALARGAGGLVAASSVAALLEACGSSSSSSSSATASTAGSGSTTTAAASNLSGTVTLLTYPGWYGPNEFSDFQKLHPGVSVKTSPGGTTGAAADIAYISTHKGSVDMDLAGLTIAPQLQAAGLLEPLNTAAIPNLSLVAPVFRKSLPYGIPTDFGKTGFGYRKDLITERPTSWHDFWTLSKKYSGKVTIFSFDVDIQGSALKYLGYSVNTAVKSQLQAMQNALLGLKPHLQAVLQTDYSKPLVEGTVVMAMDYDYDIAAAQQQNKNIVWVSPTEGMAGYLEGWVALKDSQHLDVVWALMNFHLEPKNYASFINATGSSYVEPSAEPYISKAIVENPTLHYSPQGLARVEFEKYLGTDGTAYRGKLWEEFLAA